MRKLNFVLANAVSAGGLFALGAFLLCPLGVSAEPYPDLYPNKHLQEVGPDRARQDIQACQVSTENYLASNGNAKSPARGVARKAAGGAALGALGATVMNSNAGRGAGAGAAIGAVQGVAANRKQKKEGSPEYRSYMEACLEEKGYKVVGWR